MCREYLAGKLDQSLLGKWIFLLFEIVHLPCQVGFYTQSFKYGSKKRSSWE